MFTSSEIDLALERAVNGTASEKELEFFAKAGIIPNILLIRKLRVETEKDKKYFNKRSTDK